MEVEKPVIPVSKGIKRKPSNDLTDQRLVKRFDLLNIDNNNRGSKLHSPATDSSSAAALNHADTEYMELEDSKHKVYVYDLDKELEEVQSDEEKPIFIPDIEKHLMNLPRLVLIGDDMKETAKNMQMVLYTVPTSLTIPEPQDNVRKAIIETRQRMRDRQGLTVPESPSAQLSPASMHPAQGGISGLQAANIREPSEPHALQVPTLPPSYLEPATMNGSTPDYDFQAMDMD